MKILILVKQVIADTVSLKISESHIALSEVVLQTSSLDLVAIEQAVLLKEQGVAQHITVCIVGADGSQKSLHTALAMGADDAVHIEADLSGLESLGYIQYVQAFMKQHSFDLVITGREDFDGGAGCCVVMLAAVMDWPCVDFITSLNVAGDGGFILGCDSDAGHAKITLQAPAILSVDTGLCAPRFVKFPALMKARKVSIKQIMATDLKVDIQPQFEIVSAQKISSNRKNIKLKTVEELANILKENLL